jgi:diguanylate cyclase (GGDEF)-like protein
MLTSLVRPKDRLTGIKLGADEYLTKPFEPFELVARVENLLRRMRQALSANPLTGLPGNISIENEIKSRLQDKKVFAILYTDVDNFKAFNDKYGFERGDSVIRLTAVILRSVVSEFGEKDDFIGHIGGEDFVVITTATRVGPIAEKVIENFDRLIPGQYDEDVRQRGYIWAVGRDGQEARFPLMTLSIGATIVEPGRFQHYSQVIERVKEMLKVAKAKEGSTLVVG